MATVSVAPTPSQQAHAEQLLAQPAKWSHGRSKISGESFWLIQGSKGAAHYATAYGCTCKGYQYRGACSHVLAVTMREAQQASRENPIELPVTVRACPTRYDALFPADD